MKSKNYWTAGNAMSWALGATLGVILGIALLIAIPRMMYPASSARADAPQEPAAVASTSDSSGAAKDTESAPAETASKEPTTTEETTAATTETASTDAAGAGNAEAGKTFFTGTCAGCHGAEAQGGVGPALGDAAGWSDAEFTSAVREGKAPDKELAPMMPHFGEAQVSAQQLADVHAYLKSLN